MSSVAAILKDPLSLRIGGRTLREVNAKSAFSKQERIEFYELLRFYVEDRAGPLDAIRELEIDARRRKSALETMYRIWRQELDNGAPLSQAVDGWIPSNEVAFLRIGEQGRGTGLSESLQELIPLLELEIESRRRFISSIKEPAIRFLILIVALLGLSVFLIPRFRQVLPLKESQYPGLAAAFFDFATWFGSGGYSVLILLAVVLGVALYAMPRYVGEYRKWLDRIPPFSMYRKIRASFFLILVSAMLRSRINFGDGVSSLIDAAQPWERSHFKIMLRRNGEGYPEPDSVDTGYLPDYIAARISRYAGRSSFERAFQRMGQRALRESMQQMERIGVALGYASLFGLFALILAFMISLAEVMGVITSASGVGGI